MSFRLLHASDLHLGQRFHDQDRGGDERHALDQIVAIAQREAVDVVVIAGDVFDGPNPGTGESQRYHRFLEQLVLEAGVGSVVVIAGNHDNAARIAGPQRLYARCQIHTRGAFRQDDDPQELCIPLRNRSGAVVGQALAIPFLREGDVRTRSAGETSAEAATAYVSALRTRLAQLHACLDAALPTVVVAHAFASGGREGGGERPIQVGNLGLVPAEALAGDCAYLALGHLHKPQAVGGREHWRYCGSLLPAGFDELSVPREVVIAEIPDQGPAQVRRCPLSPYRDYRHLLGEPDELRQAIQGLPEADTAAPVPWLRARARLRQPIGGLGGQLADLAQARGWQCLGVDAEYIPDPDKEMDAAPLGNDGATVNVPDLANAEAVFARVLADHDFADADGSLVESFRSLIERAPELLAEEG